jgi:hypothetical protein
MATSRSNFHAWIFVSHASDDLVQARRVRNYLEEKGASPLMFHLLALKEPEQFWPVIEKEIEARNFFLYCESEIAVTREWVRRERAAVEAVAKVRPVRIGAIRVDMPELDFGGLDAFLAKIRVFPAFSVQDMEKVQPYLDALEEAGFQIFDQRNIGAGEKWDIRIQDELEETAREHGWVVAFFTSSGDGGWAAYEAGYGVRAGAKFVPVALDPSLHLTGAFPPHIEFFDGTSDPTGAPKRLVAEMLRRKV